MPQALSPFTEIALLLLMTAGIGLIGMLLRQPLIVSFIAVGLVAGPSGLNVIHADEQIELLAKLGIAVLLFLVGIKLDIKLIRSLGAVAVVAGLGQIVITALLGGLIGLALGLDAITSLYVAIALTFSSTIIVVKLLSDKREIDALHGQIALGCLIVQDLVVVLAMIALSAIGIGEPGEQGALGQGSALMVLGSAIALILAIIIFARFLANPLTIKLAHTPELLVIFAIALAAFFAAIGDALGLGKEVGGLLAGVALASTPYRETISARLASLRDFLLLFFFVSLGAALDLSLLGSHIIGAIAFSIFVLIGKPLIFLMVIGAMGYRKRTGFLTGVTLAQISEFSLIFIAMAAALGHVSQDTLGLVTLVGLVTIAASTYMITYSNHLYALLEPILSIFERTDTPRGPHDVVSHPHAPYRVILFGLGRFGTAIGVRLKDRGIPVLGIDFNPAAVRQWRELGLDAEFGDACDPEFVGELPWQQVDWVVLTMPVHLTGLSLEDSRTTAILLLRSAGFSGRFAGAAHSPAERSKLLAVGADLVLEPFQDAAERAVELLCRAPQGTRDERLASSHERT